MRIRDKHSGSVTLEVKSPTKIMLQKAAALSIPPPPETTCDISYYRYVFFTYASKRWHLSHFEPWTVTVCATSELLLTHQLFDILGLEQRGDGDAGLHSQQPHRVLKIHPPSYFLQSELAFIRKSGCETYFFFLSFLSEQWAAPSGTALLGHPMAKAGASS